MTAAVSLLREPYMRGLLGRKNDMRTGMTIYSRFWGRVGDNFNYVVEKGREIEMRERARAKSLAETITSKSTIINGASRLQLTSN